MDMQFCGNQMRGNPAEGICDAYRLSGITHIDELIAAHRKLTDDHPGCRLLLSLDDVHQARYTSGHARNNLGLDDVTPLDIAGLPAECFENGEYIGYMTTKAEFPICVRNFNALVATASFKAACEFGLTLDDQALQEWVSYQEHPVSLLEQPLLAIVVPVERAALALAAFPNGYFACDLGPEQNYAVAEHFALEHGYELLGVGASYLGFLRPEPADSSVALALADDLCTLYNTPDEQRPLRATTFAKAIEGRRYLWLRYVE